jgi:hypothetical protein
MASWWAGPGKKKKQAQTLTSELPKQKFDNEKGTYLQMGTMDGGDVISWQDQWLIWSLLGNTVKCLGFG